MRSIAALPTEPATKPTIAAILAVAGSILTHWRKAQEAQRLAEQLLFLGDEALAARGTSREAVIDRIRRVMTERD